MKIHVRYQDLSLSRRIALRVLAAFLATVALLRVSTAIIHYQLFPHGPFRDVITKTGLHIHHLFWGILLLMITGFGALASRSERWHLRIAVIFGVALGLTLDEFALWLRLADVYWTHEGIESIQSRRLLRRRCTRRPSRRVWIWPPDVARAGAGSVATRARRHRVAYFLRVPLTEPLTTEPLP